ncbi:molybdopterin-binding/glycosyltransferase family 2 protein [Azospirillum sp. SYSU D00513]|uniref:NTP transferase domain-containing protein n=1 Tax=Azospirillum sp. SYSU D00513 TaxID=2812561 RepID=UPI001A9634F1|nr:molybdopterin-binding/glycosyltransferase family 2 protein [Azospirillum sp. SYSU D00513]
MFFGSLPLAEAEGAVLAHSLRAGSLAFKKGRLLSAADLEALRAAGVETVVAAKLGPEDVAEDEAAERIAAALLGDGLTAGAPFTGRVNLFAAKRGLLVLDPARIDAINLCDESITVATLPAFAAVEPGQMVATVKIIPFAAPGACLDQVVREASGGGVLGLAPYRALSAALIQTRLPGLKESVLDKTLEVTRARLAALGGALVAELRCEHEEEALARTIVEIGAVDLLLIAGASAITDRRDVLPAAIERAGGTVEHFGMPVDPGNLLLLASLDGKPVLGLPGCARSPKLNGFDWVLQRCAAGVPVTREEVMRMGVGGLLMEIPTRPLPRAGTPEAEAQRVPRIAALVLAAGRSTRMGGPNKLLAPVDGGPLITRTVDAVLASGAGPVLVVTGHMAEEVRAAVGARPVAFTHNPAFAEGLSTSLRAGLAALPGDVDGVLVCLGDMPRVSSAAIDRLIAAFNPLEGRAICVPVTGGKRGNPVLWDRAFFPEMAQAAGDTGAKHLIGRHAELVCEVPIDEPGVLYDVDTPELLAALPPAPAV